MFSSALPMKLLRCYVTIHKSSVRFPSWMVKLAKWVCTQICLLKYHKTVTLTRAHTAYWRSFMGHPAKPVINSVQFIIKRNFTTGLLRLSYPTIFVSNLSLMYICKQIESPCENLELHTLGITHPSRWASLMWERKTPCEYTHCAHMHLT